MKLKNIFKSETQEKKGRPLEVDGRHIGYVQTGGTIRYRDKTFEHVRNQYAKRMALEDGQRKEKEEKLDKGVLRKNQLYKKLIDARDAYERAKTDVRFVEHELKRLMRERYERKRMLEELQDRPDNLSFTVVNEAEAAIEHTQQKVETMREQYSDKLDNEKKAKSEYKKARSEFLDVLKKKVLPKIEEAIQLDSRRKQLQDECADYWEQASGALPELPGKMIWRNFLTKYPDEDIKRIENLGNGKHG